MIREESIGQLDRLTINFSKLPLRKLSSNNILQFRTWPRSAKITSKKRVKKLKDIKKTDCLNTIVKYP